MKTVSISNSRLMKFNIIFIIMAQLLLPVTFLLKLWNSSHGSVLEWIGAFYITGSYIFFIYITGAWSWFGNITRRIWVSLFIFVAVLGFPYGHTSLTEANLINIDLLLAILVGSTFIFLSIFVLFGRRFNKPALELTFPLRGGIFVVAQGGCNQLINHHVTSSSQYYALDLLKINTWGTRAKGLYPRDPSRYAIFGAEVVSPCDGVVAAVTDGFPDFSPPDRHPEHRAGNFIALEYKGSTIYLAHLQNGSIYVSANEHVHIGQVLGHVGNSGNTTEPHLHIHAESGHYTGQFSGQPAVPIRFNGHFLVRNDHVKISGSK